MIFQKKIGITPNVNTISHYLEENNSDMTTDLVEYLLMLSKKKCNYKKLIHTLHLCCDEQLELTFEAVSLRGYNCDPGKYLNILFISYS